MVVIGAKIGRKVPTISTSLTDGGWQLENFFAYTVSDLIS